MGGKCKLDANAANDCGPDIETQEDGEVEEGGELAAAGDNVAGWLLLLLLLVLDGRFGDVCRRSVFNRSYSETNKEGTN